jgi:hypothetical protein
VEELREKIVIEKRFKEGASYMLTKLLEKNDKNSIHLVEKNSDKNIEGQAIKICYKSNEEGEGAKKLLKVK